MCCLFKSKNNMNLVKGTCFFCSNSKVVSDSQNVIHTIITLFSGSEINEEKLLNLRPLKVCHLCYHSFVLIKRTHDDILHSSSAEKVHENCHLCGNSEDVIKVLRWNHFDKIGRDYRGLIGNAVSNACSDCLYYLETKNSVKDKLLAAYPELSEGLNFGRNIISHSTPLKRTRTKAERKDPLEFIDLTGINTDVSKIKPLKSDTELKKSKLIATDPKFMNQILIIKLQSLNSLEKSSNNIKKSSPQKKVRFKDLHELEEDICSTPRKINYKETRYHDNFVCGPNTEIKDDDELVEYEIKTTPRKSRYRDYSDDNSSDSPEGRKKSFFKIKLTKKKPFQSILVKPPSTVKPQSTLKSFPKSALKSPSKSPLKSKTKKSAKKRKPVTRARRNSIPITYREEKTNFNSSLVINVERMKIPESNGNDNVEVDIISNHVVGSEDILDPLRIENENSQMEVGANGSNKNDNSAKFIDALEEISQDDVSNKKIAETNGNTEELVEGNLDTEPESSYDKKEIISISSGDEIKLENYVESKETEEKVTTVKTLNETILFVVESSEDDSKNDQLDQVRDKNDAGLDKTDNTNDIEAKKSDKEGEETEDEIAKETDTSQFDENTESERMDESTEHDDSVLEANLTEATVTTNINNKIEEENVIQNQDEEETENSQEETENSQEEPVNSQEEPENSQEESENSQEEPENSQEEPENSQEETENSQEETENSQEESQEENIAEDKSASREEESKENEDDVHFNIDDIDNENIAAVLGSFETESELDKHNDEMEDSEEIKKRKREDDTLSDSNSPDKKKKKVTFSDDLSSD